MTKALKAYGGAYGKRAAACLVILGMLAQAALVASTIPVIFAISSAAAQQPGYQTIIICTGTGFKRITIDPEGNRVEGEEEEASLQDCPACALAGHAALVSVSGSEILFSHGEAASLVAPASQQSVSSLKYLCADGQGPPLEL